MASVRLLADLGDEDAAFKVTEDIAARREAEGCEAVEGNEHSPGVFLVSGLTPAGRYFTTVVNEQFIEACKEALEAVGALVGKGIAHGADALVVGEKRHPGDPLTVAEVLEAEARRGTKISRFKGLGEMDAVDLGKTTLDPATRNLVRITVDDFDAAGNFINSMMSTAQVAARAAMVQEGLPEDEEIDA
jgi:DNA gyrase/topoisomerase IV subunit B